MSNIDYNKEMRGYHADNVTLSNDDQSEMRDRRDNGRTRLRTGLNTAEKPPPKEFISQGSYAMRTMVQDADSDYDIDDGVYFEKDDLKKADGDYLGALATRQRVRNALKDDRLKYDAVVKTNCVRQNYPEGYHIDIPVYRIIRWEDDSGNKIINYELASGDEWVESDARKVTRWYNGAVGSELKKGEADTSQLRRVTKLSKKMARSRATWKNKTTSGICITKLVVDNFVSVQGHDDIALIKTWNAINAQLTISLRIEHPVYLDQNLADEGDEGVLFFRDCLSDSLETLEVYDENDCSSVDVAKAWDSVFNTVYFSNQGAEDKTATKSLLRAAVTTAGVTFPNRPVIPNKPSGFA